jgi:hypothetical protein
MKEVDEMNVLGEQKMVGLISEEIQVNFDFGIQANNIISDEESSTNLAGTEDYFRGVVNVAESYVTCSRAHK